LTLILGLETSCDETAAAIVRDGQTVLSNVVATQHDLHERYRGVVPEIASRAHLQNINPVVQESLDRAGVTLDDLDAIAVGHRPGLIGSLLVGVSAAKTLAWSANIPLIGIDHVQAHLHAATLTDPPVNIKTASGTVPDPGKDQEIQKRGSGVVFEEMASQETTPDPFIVATAPAKLTFPALGLVVSGGHTSLYAMNSPTDLALIGSTIDDAVGEAYDKVAVILNVGYPGGPKLDKLAQQGDPKSHDLPRSMLGRDSLDFSFSGLKTAVLYTVRGHPKGRGAAATFQRSIEDLTEDQIADIAAAFQAAAIEAVVKKLKRAVLHLTGLGTAPKSLVIGGGVSANSLLRTRTAELGEQLELAVRIPAFAYCLDNAAMIAGLAYTHYQAKNFADLGLPAIASGSA
jgi:tRNA N6-adenosine threonylcarbamoyltransferase